MNDLVTLARTDTHEAKVPAKLIERWQLADPEPTDRSLLLWSPAMVPGTPFVPNVVFLLHPGRSGEGADGQPDDAPPIVDTLGHVPLARRTSPDDAGGTSEALSVTVIGANTLLQLTRTYRPASSGDPVLEAAASVPVGDLNDMTAAVEALLANVEVHAR